MNEENGVNSELERICLSLLAGEDCYEAFTTEFDDGGDEMGSVLIAWNSELDIDALGDALRQIVPAMIQVVKDHNIKHHSDDGGE